MPPEPSPWDRKDFFRERKNERSSSENLGGGGGSSRWRDTPSHHHRWGFAEFRRPPGYGKQGGWHMFPEDSFHGSGPTRSNDKILDEDRGRSFGKYGRSNSRENRGGPGPVSQRDWKGHCWDAAGTAPPNGSARMQADVNERRSVDDMLTYNSHNHSDFGNSWDQLQFKDQNNKNGGVNDSSTGQRFERENSLGSIDWKPLKWTRSGSLSSRGSGFSHSSSSKSMGVDSTETKVEGHPQNVSPLQSPSGNDAAACVTSAAPSEETSSRKKPRLGWGEGLAKYEKKKVDVPDETAEKNVVICESNIEPVHCHVSNVLDRSPRIQGFLECASPATPSSVACSSSPGVEDKTSVKTVNVDTANLCGSPCPESQNQSDVLAFNLENLEVTTVTNLSSSLSELLQSDDPCSVDSGFVRSTAMNKLLVLKADISKKLEVTESEIDSLENELKSLISETGTACPRPASSSSLPVVCIWKPSEEPCAASSLIPRPAPLQLHSSGDMIMETTLSALEGELAETKDEDIDSPGTATSKFAEPLSLGKPVSEEDILKHDECLGNVDTSGTKDIEVKSIVYADNEESTGVTSSKHIASSSCRILSTDVGLRRENILCDLIMASNKDSAHRASEVFNKALPANLCCVDISRFDSSPSWKNNPLVKEKFVMRRRFLMFKERVITLKFRAFQHLWKEDLRLLSMRRCRAKSQKKFELSSRMSHSGCQKHQSSSIRSRFSSPAGNLSLVPTTEVINFASKLLADSHVKMYRSALKMPALILDKKEMMISRFTSTNGLVEDPCAAEKERCMINPWTSIEKEVFLDKLATFGKDFRKIASFLDHKTTADCVEFYYKNHKSDCFQKTKKKPEFAKQGKSYSTNTYLVTSSKRWNRDNSAASLDILGAASAIAANVDDGLKDQQKCATRYFFGTSCDSKTTRGNTGMLERSSSLDILANDRETVAADVLAGICGSLSSEAMSSCITSSIDLVEGYQERKGQIVGSSARRPLTPEVTQNVDDETCSDESCGEMDPSDWTDEEKSIFIQAVASYGKDFTMISRCVRTRSRDQCKVFFSKARKCLGLDVMRPGPCNEGTAASDDANGGGGSDTEDACFVENGSVICNDKQGSKKEEDLPSSNLKVSRDEIYPAGTIYVHSELDKLEEDNRTGELDVKDTELRSEKIVSDECAEDKVDLDLEGYNIENCVGRESLSLNVIENGFAISDTKSGQNQAIERCTLEESVIGQEDNDNGKSSVSVAEGEVYTDNSRAETAGHELLLGRSSLNDKQVGIADVNLNDLSGINCSVQGMRTVSLPAGNASVSVDTDSLGIGVLPSYEHRNAVKLDHAQNPHVDSGKECNGYVPTSFMLQDPAAVQHEKNLNHDVESKIHSEKVRSKQFQNSAITDDCHQHICGHALLDHVDPSKILRGFPVSMTTKNGTNGDIGCNKPASLHTISEVDRNFHSGRFLPKDLHLEKCNGSKHHDSGAEHSLSQDQLKDHPRKPKPQFLSDSDKPTRNGDVKLFGQILSHPPTQQRPNSRVQVKEDRGSQHAKLSDNSFNLKFTGNQNVDGIFASAKFDRNSYLGLENLPVRRSFGFWDGNRIQTGFPSLPDSAMLLAKYPAAFSNYPMSSSKVEQQHLHSSIVRSNDCNLNGATVFPSREISSSKGVADFQAYRSRDCTKLQPYTLDLKQRQDMFLSEMQIRGNEFDAVSSMQQQARGMVGINVVGRGGILLGGGPCLGVSDPVAAIKMHYAKTEQYGGQAGSIIREEESWRSNGGDIGR